MIIIIVVALVVFIRPRGDENDCEKFGTRRVGVQRRNRIGVNIFTVFVDKTCQL